MAKNDPTSTREAVTATGDDLLRLIAAAEGGKLYLTQDEGSAAFSAGMISVDPTDADSFGAIAATLTDAGRAALAADDELTAGAGTDSTAGTDTASVTSTASAFAVDKGVPMPANKPRAFGGAKRQSAYPFDLLEVGDSFHIAKTEKNPNPAMKIASSVSGARVKYSVEVKDEAGNPVTETVTVAEYAKTADGKFAKDAEGKRIKTGDKTVTKPKLEVVRDFAVKTVDASDPKGEGARVWRTK